MKRVVIFGASRGLGGALARVACESGAAVKGWARDRSRLQTMSSQYPGFTFGVADLSREEGQLAAVTDALEYGYDRAICVLGGGPFGHFHVRPWGAHVWATQVSYLFQARLIHAMASAPARVPLIVVGSSVAERAADPCAASYCAAKHALLGLVQSVQRENPDWDLRLFSPGYMDTDMLPWNAAVRQKGVYDPLVVARDLWSWGDAPDKGGHKVYPPHPGC